MTEREKMLADELYMGNDPELTEMRNQARAIIREFNASTEEDLADRERILRKLLGGAGENPFIEPPLYVDYGCHIFLGDNVFMNFDCVLLDCNHIHIGDNTMLAPRVQILTAYHPLDAHERIAGPEFAAPVTIGKNVWLGAGVIINPGVNIGDNTTIGSGSVVTKDIPANVFAAGNPCRIIRPL